MQSSVTCHTIAQIIAVHLSTGDTLASADKKGSNQNPSSVFLHPASAEQNAMSIPKVYATSAKNAFAFLVVFIRSEICSLVPTYILALLIFFCYNNVHCLNDGGADNVTHKNLSNHSHLRSYPGLGSYQSRVVSIP